MTKSEWIDDVANGYFYGPEGDEGASWKWCLSTARQAAEDEEECHAEDPDYDLPWDEE